jgi:hypothetical protein
MLGLVFSDSEGNGGSPHGAEETGQLHEAATGGTGSADTVMNESEAGGGGGSAAGQRAPEVADAAGAMVVELEEDERVRRAAEEAPQVASGTSPTAIWVTGALMVRGNLAAAVVQAQQLTAFLGVSAQWREQRPRRVPAREFPALQAEQASGRGCGSAAARDAGGWLKGPGGGLWRFDVAGQ